MISVSGFVKAYIKQSRYRGLQRSQSDANILDSGRMNLNESYNTLDHSQTFDTKTQLDTKDFEELIKFAKKEVKDYCLFTSLAKNLGAHALPIENAIRKMDQTKRFFDYLDRPNKQTIMQSILIHWNHLRFNRGTAEELSTVMHKCHAYYLPFCFQRLCHLPS